MHNVDKVLGMFAARGIGKRRFDCRKFDRCCGNVAVHDYDAAAIRDVFAVHNVDKVLDMFAARGIGKHRFVCRKFGRCCGK